MSYNSFRQIDTRIRCSEKRGAVEKEDQSSFISLGDPIRAAFDGVVSSSKLDSFFFKLLLFHFLFGGSLFRDEQKQR